MRVLTILLRQIRHGMMVSNHTESQIRFEYIMRTRRYIHNLRRTMRSGVRGEMTSKQIIEKLKELGVTSGLSGKNRAWLISKLEGLGESHKVTEAIKPTHVIRERIDSHKCNEKIRSVTQLREVIKKYEDWTDEEILNAHSAHFSIIQCMKNKSGSSLEKIIEAYLEEHNISFARQVSIDKLGKINKRSPTETLALPDIVIGSPKVGDSIQDFIVLSLKTTSRERAKQDDWTKKFPPKLFLYITTSNDYPAPDKFDESIVRKIITDKPKNTDTRKFKLSFDEIIPTIEEAL